MQWFTCPARGLRFLNSPDIKQKLVVYDDSRMVLFHMLFHTTRQLVVVHYNIVLHKCGYRVIAFG